MALWHEIGKVILRTSSQFLKYLTSISYAKKYIA